VPDDPPIGRTVDVAVSVRPDDPVVRQTLRRAMITRLATRTPAGHPFVTPIWFVPVGPRIVMGTGEQSVSVRNLRAHPEAVLLFDAPGVGVLRLRGPAVVRAGLPRPGALLRVILKYYLSPGGLRAELAHLDRRRLRGRYMRQSRPAAIEVTLETAEWLPRPGAA
jgi:Pyridoxamine 5'-phosphate oxidase